MAFLDIYPSYSKWYGIPNGDSDPLYHDFEINYGIKEDKSYFLFRNESASQKKYAVSTNIYRHIYALGKMYVLDMNTIVNGRMCYVEYIRAGTPECIYFTPRYGWVLIPLYIASQLYKDDDISQATAYRNEFEVGLQDLYRNIETQESIKEVY